MKSNDSFKVFLSRSQFIAKLYWHEIHEITFKLNEMMFYAYFVHIVCA